MALAFVRQVLKKKSTVSWSPSGGIIARLRGWLDLTAWIVDPVEVQSYSSPPPAELIAVVWRSV